MILENFCFDEDGGKVRLWFDDHTANNDTFVLFYSDQEQSWGAIEDMEGATCDERVAKAKHSRPIKQLETLTSYRINNMRPRWWYIGVANCKGPMNFEYRITFLNTNNKFEQQFGWDQHGMYAMSVVFFMFQFFITLGFAWIVAAAAVDKLQKRVPIIFLISSFAEMLGLFLLMVHFSVYAWNGVGIIQLDYTYLYLDMFSQMAFMVTIFLLVKGWPASLTSVTLSQIIGFNLFTLNILSYILLFTWYTAGWDHISTLYLYDSIAGYIIIAIRAATFVWCEYELYRTLKLEKEDAKKMFYMVLAGFIAFWFLYLPINVLVSHLLQAWVRAKTIYAVIFTLNTISFLFPLGMFWPIKRNPWFSMIDISGKGEAYNSKTNISQNVAQPLP